MERDLVAQEGVDEGSARSVTESASYRPPVAAGTPEPHPAAPEQQAAPEPVAPPEGTPARDGQQLQVGEG